MAKSEKMVSVNGERLKYAREHYGLSLEEVAEKLNLKTDTLKMFEENTEVPSYAQLEKLSDFYERPLLYFFFAAPPKSDGIAVAFRRLEKNIGGRISIQIRKMIEKANVYKLNLSEMYADKMLPTFEDLLLADSVTDESLAGWLRIKINLPLEKQKQFAKADSFLEYLRERLYNIGIYVFKDSFKDDSVSGLCLYDAKYPVILLNNKTSFNRQVFTVFHEIFHIFEKEFDIFITDRHEEKACDRFAGDFLIPDEDFETKLKNIENYEDLSLIKRLADEYTVSLEAIAYRLLSKKLISNDFYFSTRDGGIRKMDTGSAGGNFYSTQIAYLGKSYLKRVFGDYYNGRINAAAVGKYTGLKTVHISRLSSNMFGGEF